MSTRGAVGIRMNGIDKIGYNHFDSYPSGLGNDILKGLSNLNFNELKNIFNAISLDQTNNEDWAWNWKIHTFNLSFKDSHIFLADSLFCEYAYIINLDTNMLEYYVGFNKNKNAAGRYAKQTVDEEEIFYGVVLKKEIPLQDIFDNKIEIFEDNVNE